MSHATISVLLIEDDAVDRLASIITMSSWRRF